MLNLTIIQIFFSCLFSLWSAQIFYEGDKCILPLTNELGKCIRINYCEAARNLLEIMVYPGHCGFVEGNIPLVCCPIFSNYYGEPEMAPGELSKDACDKHYGKRRIATEDPDGIVLNHMELPHMAAVGYNDLATQSILYLCGGSLISSNFVLSAAHCACDKDYDNAQWIRLGDLNLETAFDDNAAHTYKITDIYVHPNYTYPSIYHDISLFKIDNTFPVPFAPACLHTEKHLPVSSLEAAGWGAISATGPKSAELRRADLQIMKNEMCSKKYKIRRKMKNGILEEIQICAGDSQGLKDTCQGDSGGPFHYVVETHDAERHFVIAGITSFGYICGGTAAIYTRVSAYIDWIEDVVWRDDPKRRPKPVEKCFPGLFPNFDIRFWR